MYPISNIEDFEKVIEKPEYTFISLRSRMDNDESIDHKIVGKSLKIDSPAIREYDINLEIIDCDISFISLHGSKNSEEYDTNITIRDSNIDCFRFQSFDGGLKIENSVIGKGQDKDSMYSVIEYSRDVSITNSKFYSVGEKCISAELPSALSMKRCENVKVENTRFNGGVAPVLIIKSDNIELDNIIINNSDYVLRAIDSTAVAKNITNINTKIGLIEDQTRSYIEVDNCKNSLKKIIEENNKKSVIEKL